MLSGSLYLDTVDNDNKANCDDALLDTKETLARCLNVLNNVHSEHLEQVPPGLNLYIRCVICGSTGETPTDIEHKPNCWLAPVHAMIEDIE